MPHIEPNHGAAWPIVQPAEPKAERPQPPGKDEEKAVASQFEGMLVEHLLKGMRQGTFAAKADFGRQTFEQMFDEEIARAVSAQGLGLGETLFAPNVRLRPQDAAPPVDMDR